MNYATINYIFNEMIVPEPVIVLLGVAAAIGVFWAVGCLVGAFIKTGGR